MMTPAKPILAALVLAGILFVFPAAHAQKQSNFYLGGAFGQSTFKEFCSGGPTVLTCDEKDMGWKFFAGYRFNPYFAVEGTYIDWGEASGTVTTPTTRVVPLSQTGLGLAAVGSFQATPQFAIFGKAGLLWSEQKTPASLSGNVKRDEDEFHYGVGARFSFTPNWVARAEWERAKDTKVEMLSIGLEYRF